MSKFLAIPFAVWLLKLIIKIGVASSIVVALYWAAGKMSDRAKTFWVAVFSDQGTPSFSRVTTAVIVAAALFWISFIVYETRVIPDVGGVVLLIGTLYGANVAGNVGKAFADKGKPPA